MKHIIAAAVGTVALMAAAPASAEELAFTAALRGDRAPTATGSKATGQARIVVDTQAQTVDLTLDVAGMTVDDLWDRLVPAPLGPIHLHVYATHDHSNPDSAELLFPVPFGPHYTATAAGFRVAMKRAPYADGAARVQSKASFDAFVGALRAGKVLLNIHTDAKNDGEISGPVVPA